MRSHSVTLMLVALLAACTADNSGETTSDAGTTGGASTTAVATDSSTSGSTATADATSDAPTGTGEVTGTTSTTSSSTTGDTSTSGVDTEVGTTGPDGVLGAAALDAMDALEMAVAGVTYPSESDYPWVVVGFADAAPVSEANVKDVIAGVYVPHEGQAPLVDRAIEQRTLAQLMDPLTVPQDWWDDYNKMVAAQYTEIRAVLATRLVDIQVFRLGELSGDVLQGAIDIYVLGATPDGDVVGMWTVSIET
jgi:hypothetical protein